VPLSLQVSVGSEEHMAQRFTSLEDAATQLGISKERLSQLREAGKVRAYRDGASWKFRSEDVEKFGRDGIPQIDPGASDIGLDLDADEGASASAAEASGLDLDLAEDDAAISPASDINLEDVEEPTVAGMDDEGSDALAIDLDDNPISLSDSILLNEAELGGTTGRPPSTIIGKADLDLDADLDLAPAERGAGPASDVKLAPASDILPAGDDDIALDLPSPSDNFEGLEELEVDLEAESSRILTPEDTRRARGAAAASAAAAGAAGESSDLQLAPTDSDMGRQTSDIGLGRDAASGTGLTGLSALELEDDDQVLGDGSDVTLSGESSGINIISPSDSGLALDEVSLDLSGSAPMGSSLDLGNVSADDLQPLSINVGPESKVGDDFQLTPLGEEGDDEERDSSQVIALDEISEEAGAPLASGGLSETGMLTEDFGVGLAPGAVVVGASEGDTPFSLANVLSLAGCLLLLSLSGMMVYDLMRNIWSWGEVTTVNSSLLEVLNPFL
jgi:excisionase family DNA binding protein